MHDLNIQNLIDAMTENAAIVDETGRILQINKAWSEFSLKNNGPLEDTTIGVNYFSTVRQAAKEGDEFARKAEIGIHKILTKDISIFELEYPCHSENEQRWFIANIQEIHTTSPRKFLFTHKDVSNLVIREKRVIETQRLQAIGQLTGGISHDFNNLLGIILGNLELARAKLSSPNIIEDHLENSLSAVKRGTSLVQKLLSFAQNQKLTPEKVNTTMLITNALNLLKPALGEDVEIQVEFNDEPLAIEVDSTMLYNAIFNIAINARHAMKNGGTLKFNISRKEFNEHSFGTDQENISGAYVLISISDNGCGISAENLNKVMDPFFTTKKSGEGSGLGLSMVHGFIKQSSGHIDISSQVGQGTTVYLYLPLIENANLAELLSKNLSTAPRINKTVLLVEDDADVRQTISHMLDSLGCNVIQAENGKHALDTLNKSTKKVDLVLSDNILPTGISGIDLSNKIKQSYPDIKFLLMTGYPCNNHSEQESLTLQPVLKKPFSISELGEVIQNTLT